MKKKTLLTALILGAMTVPSVFAYDDIDGVITISKTRISVHMLKDNLMAQLLQN